jgi:hypothetical protein
MQGGLNTYQIVLSAFSLDLQGFLLYTHPLAAAGDGPFFDPLKDTEMRILKLASTPAAT